MFWRTKYPSGGQIIPHSMDIYFCILGQIIPLQGAVNSAVYIFHAFTPLYRRTIGLILSHFNISTANKAQWNMKINRQRQSPELPAKESL
jgi:hypothetical protein